MPKLGGPEAYAKISEIKSGVPVIFSTGYSSEAAQLADAAEQGAAILQKPYTPSALALKIREILDVARS